MVVISTYYTLVHALAVKVTHTHNTHTLLTCYSVNMVKPVNYAEKAVADLVE